jgi:hypothetical protein
MKQQPTRCKRLMVGSCNNSQQQTTIGCNNTQQYDATSIDNKMSS